MPVSMEVHESHTLIRLEGEFTVGSAAEVKSALGEGLASGKDLRLDLEAAERIDITVMQLLWAVGLEAERTGVSMAICVSEAAGRAAREAGFDRFPGDRIREGQGKPAGGEERA